MLIYCQHVFSSLCRLDDAILFKDISADDILEVENFVREKLMTVLKSKKHFDTSESNMVHFFGETFASNPSHFKFLIGDKKLINIMVSYVKKTVDEGNINYFKSKPCEFEQNKENSMTDDAKRTYYFLNKLLSTAKQNSQRSRGGYRYDKETRMIASYLRMIMGPLAYDTLQNNLKCALPSLPSTNRYIRSSQCRIFEGVLRSEELFVYLTARNLPLVVSLSEDATRIIGRVQYDSVTNQLVGFVLPINEKNGMPVPFAFPARNANEMLSHFSSPNSSSQFLNIIMAQPMADVAPFCLLVYGSDNKFTSVDVINKWNYIIETLKQKNIEVLVISSDSDPRYNSAMKQCSKLGAHSNIYGIKNKFGAFCVQDMVHIATKLRNFFLRTALNIKIIPFGNRFIKLQHLLYIVANFRKDLHELTASILNPIDKQNFASVQHMYDKRVINLLKCEVDKSEATALFLDMIRDITESYMDPTLTPLERVRKIWYPLFIIRIWKKFISNSKKYKLKDNFLSTNCYSCLELNGHSMIEIMLYLKEAKREELFLPYLLGSQQCESTFRQLRSLTSTYSTVTNCTVKESVSRVSKIQLQNEIIHSVSSDFIFPRAAKKNRATNEYQLPSKKEIFQVIAQCKLDAINMAYKFELLPAKSMEKMKREATSCQIKQCVSKQTK